MRRGRAFDVIVIGAGLSGLAAAERLAAAGARGAVIAKGGGYLHFTSGCIDVLARMPDGGAVSDPLAAVEALSGHVPAHPYTLTGSERVRAGLQAFKQSMEGAGLPFGGDEHANVVLPTAIGATRTTCLVPDTMSAGSLAEPAPMLIVGFNGFRDFYPPYLAANLARTGACPVRHLYLDLPALRGRRHLLPLDLARALDDAGTREEVARQVKSNLGGAGRVGFPAVLGLDRHAETFRALSHAIGCPLFEIPTLPPSVPGIRLDRAYRRRLRAAGVRVEIGFWVRGRLDGTRAVELLVDAAGGALSYSAGAFVLATGGTGGGGIMARPDGSLCETVFDLPVLGGGDRTAWYRERFLGPEPQPISLSGIPVNERLQPLLPSGDPVENVFVTASNLPHWDPVREGSGEGVALATAHLAAAAILGLPRHSSEHSPEPLAAPAGARDS